MKKITINKFQLFSIILILILLSASVFVFGSKTLERRKNLQNSDNEIIDEKIIVKIDCEGSEYEILERLNDTGLLPRYDVIIIEWHYKGDALLRKILNDNNFKVLVREKHVPDSDSGMLYAFKKEEKS